MKKVLLAAAVLTLFAGTAMAEMWKVPHGDSPQSLATADYGGVQSSTAAFFVGTSTIVAQGKGVCYGVVFSSGSAYDFVDLFDSTTTLNGVATGITMRLFNINMSTGGAGGTAAGFSGPAKPFRFYKGLYMRPGASNVQYNMINTLYYSEQDVNKKP